MYFCTSRKGLFTAPVSPRLWRRKSCKPKVLFTRLPACLPFVSFFFFLLWPAPFSSFSDTFFYYYLEALKIISERIKVSFFSLRILLHLNLYIWEKIFNKMSIVLFYLSHDHSVSIKHESSVTFSTVHTLTNIKILKKYMVKKILGYWKIFFLSLSQCSRQSEEMFGFMSKSPQRISGQKYFSAYPALPLVSMETTILWIELSILMRNLTILMTSEWKVKFPFFCLCPGFR